MLNEIPVFNANSVGPDKAQHSSASGLGLHCLPVTRVRGHPRGRFGRKSLPKLADFSLY